MPERQGDDKTDKFFIMRTFCVFNADKVEGAERFQAKDNPPAATLTGVRARRRVDESNRGRHFALRRQAFYSLAGDLICLPRKRSSSRLAPTTEVLFTTWAPGPIAQVRTAIDAALGRRRFDDALLVRPPGTGKSRLLPSSPRKWRRPSTMSRTKYQGDQRFECPSTCGGSQRHDPR